MDGKISSEYNISHDINNSSENQLPSYDDKKPFFLMTLEDNMGKCQQIKIYQNSNASELAYYFCKENNLDFTSMKYIKSNIKSIIKKFNEPQQKALIYNNSNNSIKEEDDEDDYLTEGTVKSNEKQKIKENEEENYLKGNNLQINNQDIINNSKSTNKIEENKFPKNLEEIKDKDSDNKNETENFEKQSKYNEKSNSNKESLDIYNKNTKSLKSIDKESKSFEILNSQMKSINNFGKIPLKINPISPKQIEINENIHKIINNSNKSTNIISTKENINNNISESNNDINKSNYNIMNTTDRSRNSAYISIVDKEIKEISNSTITKEKMKVSDKKETQYNISPYRFPKEKDKNYCNKNEKEGKENKNCDKKKDLNNFDINYFGEKYINLNKSLKENNNQSESKEDISKSLEQCSDSLENGVPVLSDEEFIEKENNNKTEFDNIDLSLDNKKVKKDEKSPEIKNLNNNGINKKIILNKMKKLENNIIKKNNKKKNEINKLLKLIKNSCYNINKSNRNKVIKDKKSNTNIFNIDRLKIKENNSLDINYELSRNLEKEQNDIHSKELNNNLNTKSNKINKKNNKINTNFNAYIGNNKNYLRKNNNLNNFNELNQNTMNSLNRKYFFSNPNLSSNQEAINLSNAIFNIKHNLKNLKNDFPTKSKSLGKDKNRKINSTSKNKIKLSKKYNFIINNKIKLKDLIKEKTRRSNLKHKNKNKINNNSSTPNNINDIKIKYLKSCQTPPSKKTTNTEHYINTLFSEWLMSTVNRDSRNILTTRDYYFKKNKEKNKTSKSVSELVDTIGKKSNYRMILSKSNFKITRPNAILKNLKYINKNKSLKENNNSNIKNNNHHYVNSLKISNRSNTLYQKNNLNKNKINNTINNDRKIMNQKTSRKNKVMLKRQMEKIRYFNFNNNNSNIKTINDYNFNNNNSYIRKFINNTIHTFMYDSTENSKSEDKFKKIIQKQLTSPSKTKFFDKKTKKKSSDKIASYKNGLNKMGKILLNNSDIISNENGKNNININNLININNYQKNKNYNFNYNTNNGNNHYIKNSRLKKNKIFNKINGNLKNENNKRLINFSNELTKYYLNTEIYKHNYNNMTYSNFINNNISLSNYDLSLDEKKTDDILTNIFSKLFIFFNRDRANKIILFDNYYNQKINLFPYNIKKLLNYMIDKMFKNFRKEKKGNLSNNSLVNSTKNNNENLLNIDKKNFINGMMNIYKYYMSVENKKLLITFKNDINKVIQDNIVNNFFSFYK